MSFDIVIPLGPNEIQRFHEQLVYTKKNIIGYRNIYIITSNFNIKFDDCIMIDENIFPFKQFISSYFEKYNGKNNRNGWYFQQLIKLYAGYIEGILDNYLALDADVFFLKPTEFMTNDNKPIFSTSSEHNVPYFTHMNLLDSNFKKYHKDSGICHHMLFNKNYINEIFNIVETNHNIPFWQVFILSVNEHTKHEINVDESGASEYELYFNYMFKNYNDNIIIRNLNWKNISKIEYYNNYYDHNLDFISICNYI
jgi:hypothetical protein